MTYHFSQETDEQFADRFAGAWRSVVMLHGFDRDSFIMVEDILRVALAAQDNNADAKELLSRARKIAGPGINGARLLTEIDDFLLSIEGRNLGLWRIVSDGTQHRDDFAFWRVEMADLHAEPVADGAIEPETEPVEPPAAAVEPIEAVDIEPEPLEALAKAWFDFAAAAQLGAQTAGGLLNAVRTRTETAKLVALGDQLLLAVADCASTDNSSHGVRANRLSKFLTKSAGLSVDVVTDDGEAVAVAFELQPDRDPTVRRWLLRRIEQ